MQRGANAATLSVDSHRDQGLATNNSALQPSDPKERHRALFRPLFFGLTAGLLLLAFALLGGEVLEGETRSFDTYLLREAQSLRARHPGVADVMRDLSGLGSTVVLTLFTVITVGYLVVVSARVTALVAAVSVVSGSVLVGVFKSSFGRLRPDAAYSDIAASGLSFPSGHATMSAAVFLTIGTLIASRRTAWNERVYILLAAATLTVLVGVSRVVLGVHWSTDVAGGWAFGSGWAIVWLLVARHAARRDPTR